MKFVLAACDQEKCFRCQKSHEEHGIPKKQSISNEKVFHAGWLKSFHEKSKLLICS